MLPLPSSIFGPEPLVQDLDSPSNFSTKLRLQHSSPSISSSSAPQGRLYEVVELGHWRTPSLLITSHGQKEDAKALMSSTADWAKWHQSKWTTLRVWPGVDARGARDACRSVKKSKVASSSSSSTLTTDAIRMERLTRSSSKYRLVTPSSMGQGGGHEVFEWRSEPHTQDKVALRKSLEGEWKGSRNWMSTWSLVRVAGGDLPASEVGDDEELEEEEEDDDDKDEATLADSGDAKVSPTASEDDLKEPQNIKIVDDEEADEGVPHTSSSDDLLSSLPLSSNEQLICTFVAPRRFSKAWAFQKKRGKLVWHSDAVKSYGLATGGQEKGGWNALVVTSLLAVLQKMEQIRQNAGAAAGANAGSVAAISC